MPLRCEIGRNVADLCEVGVVRTGFTEAGYSLTRRCLALVVAFAISCGLVSAAEPDAKEKISSAVKAVGGEDKLLKLFRIKERLNVSPDPEKQGSERTSVLEPPKYWWLGKRERVSQDKEPATFLVWGWTLGAITDPKSKVESIPDIKDGDADLFGLRVSETVTPPMDLYFDKTTSRLVRIDWRSDIHRFSEWKDHDGVKYPAKCIGFKKSSGKPWYFTEILELERLKELPAGLTRP